MTDHASWLAYVGCRTTRERNAQGRGLMVFRCATDKAWTRLQLVEGLRNPSFLCLHPTQPMLYAVHGDFEEITRLRIGKDGLLTQLQQLSTWGRNPVHLAFTPSGGWLLVANYATGTVVSLRAAEDGTLGEVAHLLALPGERGPHAQQDGSHPHQICFSPDGAFAFVPDKGVDCVFAVQVNEDTGCLAIAGTAHFPAGTGPRHMVFHPSLPLAYLVGELERSVTTLRRDGPNLTAIASVSSLPLFVDDGSAAGIVLSADLRTLYVSNRGHDSVVAFPVDSSGGLGAPTWVAAGRTPRFITESPDRDGLVIAREDGHSIALLSANSHSYQATDVVETGSPVCIVFRRPNQ
jgi:6-phosphogluconolactonase